MERVLTADEVKESFEIAKRLDSMQGSVGVDYEAASSGYVVLKNGKVVYESKGKND